MNCRETQLFNYIKSAIEAIRKPRLTNQWYSVFIVAIEPRQDLWLLTTKRLRRGCQYSNNGSNSINKVENSFIFPSVEPSHNFRLHLHKWYPITHYIAHGFQVRTSNSPSLMRLATSLYLPISRISTFYFNVNTTTLQWSPQIRVVHRFGENMDRQSPLGGRLRLLHSRVIQKALHNGRKRSRNRFYGPRRVAKCSWIARKMLHFWESWVFPAQYLISTEWGSCKAWSSGPCNWAYCWIGDGTPPLENKVPKCTWKG